MKILIDWLYQLVVSIDETLGQNNPISISGRYGDIGLISLDGKSDALYYAMLQISVTTLRFTQKKQLILDETRS